MIIHIVIISLLSTLGGYIAFFKPVFLSENIEPLESNRSKRVWFYSYLMTVFISFLLLLPLEILHISILYIFSWVLFLGFIDACSGIIPNRLLYFGLLGWILLLWTGQMNFISIVPSVISSLLIICIRFGSEEVWGKAGFGWGDIKLIFILGLLSGWEIFWILYFAVLLGGLFSLFIMSKRSKRVTIIHFAPFLMGGYLFVKILELHHNILVLISR